MNKTTLLLAGLFACTANAEPVITDFNVLGFTDAEHTGTNNYRYSYANQQNQAGDVIGYSQRRNSSNNNYEGQTAWQAVDGVTIKLGLTNATHTGTNNYQYSNASQQNEAGDVIGYSQRRNSSTNGYEGQSAWQAVDGVTTRLGYTDAAHTGSNNYQYSNATAQNEAGAVIGYSERRNSSNNNYEGRTVWVAENGAMTQLGFTDSAHTGTNNYQVSYARDINEAGDVIGESDRRNSTTNNYEGRSAWQYSNGTTTRIGLTDSAHTGTNNYQNSYAQFQNEAGDVAGTSQRLNSSTNAGQGQSAWQAVDGVTTRVGLTTAAHTGSNDYQYSTIQAQNEAGSLIGYSDRRNSSTNNFEGRDVWQAVDGVTTQIGLTDSAHTGTNGYRTSYAQFQNEAGDVAGYSDRRNSSTNAGEGRSVWQAVDGITTKIGLYDAEHTGSNNYQYSSLNRQNEAGHVIGYSQRRDSSNNYQGQSAWQAIDGVTTRLGIFDATHTGTNNYQRSWINGQNELGDVIGYSERRDSNSNAHQGHTAWYRDLSSAVMYTFNLPNAVNALTGYSYSIFQFINDAGVALGRYSFFDSNNNQQWRAMGFTVNDGFFDLGSILEDSLTDFDLLALYDGLYLNDSGQVVGRAYDQNNNTSTIYQATIQLARAPNLVSSVAAPQAMVFTALLMLLMLSRRNVRFTWLKR
ncbi:hypothetical protein [Alteromonas sp. KUL49]|uniref:hypothetical protein n=1 Tax=Alteromonas sp. KUL49 TaxID=2480798 RepID=UPI00102F27DD|nr:hypothetical protein [Alteromonas sp. KUL49]TAP38037.1 hypothetical protein EYS00_16235 [Alteromonas sp. KUL49]GEA12916.1 hypothetical protein KUL49_32910 [Alteromonas sp. KUL49]